MIKHTNFDEFDWNGWPHPHELERFFLAPKGQEWSFAGRNDSWGLKVEGLCGTDGRPGFEQVTADLTLTAFFLPTHDGTAEFNNSAAMLRKAISAA